jgi:polyferredoxin
MAENSLPDQLNSPRARPAMSWVLKMLLWAVIGAIVGALWALFHYGTEGWSGPVVILTVSFAIIGAILSLVVGRGCGT